MSEVNDANEVVTKGYLRETLREEFAAFRGEMREMLRPMVAAIANLQTDMTDVRHYMKTQLVTRDEFHARMDAFSGRVDDSDYSHAKQRARLDDHERRISALEKKPS